MVCIQNFRSMESWHGKENMGYSEWEDEGNNPDCD